jgi:ribosomal protein S18 acetylase RimI-like enzyme
VQFPIDMAVLPSAIEFTEENSYVWSSGEQLIAFGQIVNKPDGRRHLARIIINPRVRRCGHGAAFVRELLENASGRRVSLNVAEHNSGALALYRKLGFVDAVRPPGESASPNSRYMEHDTHATTAR